MSNAIELSPTLPLGSLDAYRHAINSVPVLSVSEEYELARRYRDEEDLEAAWALVTSHLRFVGRIARGYSGYGLPEADLVQEGNIGLMKAVKRFNPDVGVRLVSFAVHWIRAEIHEYILKNWRIVKVATTKAQRKLFFNLRNAKKRLGWLNREEVEAVAEDLGVSPSTVMEMEQRLNGFDTAFDAPTDSDSDECWAPAAYLQDLRFEPSELVETADWDQRSEGLLHSALETLDARSQEIVRRRWLGENKATLQDLGSEYGVSAERIRQLEKSAMKKLRVAMEAAD